MIFGNYQTFAAKTLTFIGAISLNNAIRATLVQYEAENRVSAQLATAIIVILVDIIISFLFETFLDKSEEKLVIEAKQTTEKNDKEFFIHLFTYEIWYTMFQLLSKAFGFVAGSALNALIVTGVQRLGSELWVYWVYAIISTILVGSFVYFAQYFTTKRLLKKVERVRSKSVSN